VRRPRATRAGERGFTLVEVLVSMTLLTIIGAVMGVIFSVGMRSILAPGASEDRLTASSQSITLEQLLAEDVHQATCVEYVDGTQAVNAYGNCAGNAASPDFFQNQCKGTANVLCMGWPDTPSECAMALYPLSTTPASRSSGMTDAALTTADYPAVTVISSPPTDTWRAAGMQVPITIRAGNLLTTSLALRPLAADPWGSGGASTC